MIGLGWINHHFRRDLIEYQCQIRSSSTPRLIFSGCLKGPVGTHQWDLHLDRLLTEDYALVRWNGRTND